MKVLPGKKGSAPFESYASVGPGVIPFNEYFEFAPCRVFARTLEPCELVSERIVFFCYGEVASQKSVSAMAKWQHVIVERAFSDLPQIHFLFSRG